MNLQQLKQELKLSIDSTEDMEILKLVEHLLRVCKRPSSEEIAENTFEEQAGQINEWADEVEQIFGKP